MTVKLPRNVPAKADVYYSPRHDEYLFIFGTDRGSIDEFCYYKPMNITAAREEFLRINHAESLTDELISRWHEHFFTVLNNSYRKSRRRKNPYYLTSRLLSAECGGLTYYIAKPKSTELMLYIADRKPRIDFMRLCRCMISGDDITNKDYFYDKEKDSFSYEHTENSVLVTRKINIDEFSRDFSKGKYPDFESFKANEGDAPIYADFLRSLFGKLTEHAEKWCAENNIDHLINLGKPQIGFIFGDIGFTDVPFQGNAYYLPEFNSYIFGEQEYTNYCEKYSSDCWNSADELIKIPIYASPRSILEECGLSAEKSYDGGYMDYCLDDEIYYDNFWNQYGIRTVEEQQMIYKCICRYKVMEYNWFAERGARLMLTDTDRKDLGFPCKHKK
ncbi:MAG: hypothetical protein ACI4XF_04980 [Oscillospiraceae bacterium]